MVHLPPTEPASNAAPTPSPAKGSPLRPGEILQAIAVAGTPTGRLGGDALLKLGSQVLPVFSPRPLEKGDRLTLRVARTGANPVLQVLPRVPQDTEAGGETLLAALAPRQAGLNKALGLMHTLARTPSALNGLPAPVRGAVERVLAALPRPGQVRDPAGLRRAVSDSGVALESRLARALAEGAAPATARDIKNLLLALLKALGATARVTGTGSSVDAGILGQWLDDPPPPLPGMLARPVPQGRKVEAEQLVLSSQEFLVKALSRLAEGAVARIALHQLASRETGPEGEARWFSELALSAHDGVDLVHLALEARRQHHEESSELREWRAAVALDLPGLGPLEARLTLVGQRVSTLFWSGEVRVRSLVERNLPRLGQALSQRGFEVVAMGIAEPRPEDSRHSGAWTTLVDTHA